MRRLFGQKKDAAPEPTLGDACDKLDSRGGAIDEKIKKLDEKLNTLRVQIQRTRGPQKERLTQQAMQVLKQRKMYDSQRSQVYQQQFAMDQLNFTKEMMEDTQLQVKAMRETKKHMTKVFQNFSTDEVERMQDDLAELYEQHQEVQEVMGRAYGVDDYVDEGDLQDELDALAFDMEKQADASYLDEALLTPSTKLPDAPGVSIPGEAVPEAPQQQAATDPYALEAQLGL